MTVGGGQQWHSAAQDAPTGPGLEIEQGQPLPPSQPECVQQPDAPGLQRAIHRQARAEIASTAPHVSVSDNQGVGTEVTSLSMNLNNYNGIGGVSYHFLKQRRLYLVEPRWKTYRRN